MKNRRSFARWGARLGALLMGPLFYVLCRGWKQISPSSLRTSFRWMSSGDRFPALAGWLDFYRDPWQFPLGKFSSQFAPHGGYLGYTDSIPWFSVLMKLVAPGRPGFIQFFGIYELVSYALFAYFAYRLLELFKLKTRDCFLGALLLLFSPVLINRAPHIALCSQWEILAAFFLYFGRGGVASWLALVFIASSTHPYLGVMVGAIACASACASSRACGSLTGSLRRGALRAVLYLGAMGGTFWLFGYFAVKNTPTYGFEVFSSDLLAFFNSMWLSRFLPQIRMSPSQAEGFAYLGLGVLGLGIFLGIERWRGRRHASEEACDTAREAGPKERVDAPRGPLLAAALALAFYSLSSHVSIAGHTIFTIEWLYKPFPAVTNAFRACGRFIWVLYYYVYVLIILGVALGGARGKRNAKAVTALLAAAVLLQWLDLGHAIAHAREPVGEIPAEVSPGRWSSIPASVRHIEFVPEGFPDPRFCETGFFDPSTFLSMALFMVERGISTNSGYRAHFNQFELAGECRAEARAFVVSGWNPATAYVFPLGPHGTARVTNRVLSPECRPLNGLLLCVKG